MAKATASSSTEKHTLRIPEQTVAAFEARAGRHNRSVDVEMVEHLNTTSGQSSLQPIYLSDTDRDQLSQISGRSIRTAADLLAWARHISSIDVAGTTVTLPEQLLTRLDSRRFGKTMPEYIRNTVVEQLEQTVGLR